jgi:transcription antitermination protein NusB
MAPGSRRRARTAVLQALFEADNSKHEATDCLQRVISEQRLGKSAAEFAERLLEGVLEKLDDIDVRIGAAAPAWPVNQLAAVDRNILRLAISEMLSDNGAPVGAIINEAVELAKSFGSDTSSSFVNGVLGSIAREMEQAEANQPTVRRG